MNLTKDTSGLISQPPEVELLPVKKQPDRSYKACCDYQSVQWSSWGGRYMFMMLINPTVWGLGDAWSESFYTYTCLDEYHKVMFVSVETKSNTEDIYVHADTVIADITVRLMLLCLLLSTSCFTDLMESGSQEKKWQCSPPLSCTNVGHNRVHTVYMGCTVVLVVFCIEISNS